MTTETPEQRTERILGQLRSKYPGKSAYDLDGRALHFLCEVEPVSEHPEYDKAVEVIINSRPHKHLKMKQWYTIISGTLEVHASDKVVTLHEGDKYIIEPGTVHWAISEDECWLEILSKPGWTKEDHILVNLNSKVKGIS